MIDEADEKVFERQMQMAGEFAKIAATLLQGRIDPSPDAIHDACHQATVIFGTCLQLTLKACQEGGQE